MSTGLPSVRLPSFSRTPGPRKTNSGISFFPFSRLAMDNPLGSGVQKVILFGATVMRHPLHLLSVLVMAACLFAAAPASAHHSFAAEFDRSNCGEFTGTLTDVDWENPHAYFFIERKDANPEQFQKLFDQEMNRNR